MCYHKIIKMEHYREVFVRAIEFKFLLNPFATSGIFVAYYT